MSKNVALKRILLSFVVSTIIGFAMSEITFILLGRPIREAETITLVIPPGTAALVARGEQPPTIAEDMQFVVGDTLVVQNNDSVNHQLGPLWIPAGTSGQLSLGESQSLAFECSFQPSKYLGLEINNPLTFSTRLLGTIYAGIPLGILISLYLFSMPDKQKVAA